MMPLVGRHSPVVSQGNEIGRPGVTEMLDGILVVIGHHIGTRAHAQFTQLLLLLCKHMTAQQQEDGQKEFLHRIRS